MLPRFSFTRVVVPAVISLFALASGAKASVIGMVAAAAENQVKISAVKTAGASTLIIQQSSDACATQFSPGSDFAERYIGKDSSGRVHILLSLYDHYQCDVDTERGPRTQRFDLASMLANAAFDEARDAINSGDVILTLVVQEYRPGSADASLASASIDLLALTEKEQAFYDSSTKIPASPTAAPAVTSDAGDLNGNARYNACAATAKSKALAASNARHAGAQGLKIVGFESYAAPYETAIPWFWYLVVVSVDSQTRDTWYVEGSGMNSGCQDGTVTVLQEQPMLWPNQQ